MSTDPASLVRRFYEELWNRADVAVAPEILAADFRFRGSLGPERQGIDGFLDYHRAIHAALADFTCIIDDLVTTTHRAAARMTFRGTHRAPLFGIEATGRTIAWSGAAFFTTDGTHVTHLWVLGDVDAVRAQLGAANGAGFG